MVNNQCGSTSTSRLPHDQYKLSSNVPKIHTLNLSISLGEVEKTFESDDLEFNLTKKDVGRYRCTSENKLGKIERTIQIKYYGKLR